LRWQAGCPVAGQVASKPDRISDAYHGVALALSGPMAGIRTVALFAATALLIPACMDDAEVEDGESDNFYAGKADGGLDEGSPEALAVLAMVNDPTITSAALKSGAHVTTRVADNITKHRNGADAKAGTADDDRFDTLAELDKVPYVGPATLNALVEFAKTSGYLKGGAKISLVFSPKATVAESHLAKIAQLIAGAQHDVDIAIYSYSDAGIAKSLADAVKRGVRVRFLFDTANTDKKAADAATTASGRLERDGVDVRYVNQILHHKFLIVDGPRDDKSRAATAHLVTGSANWSNSAAVSFDENTFFVDGSAELAAAYQNEFDKLWLGSRDFVGGAAAQGQSMAKITTADVADDPGIEALFTSANFTPSGADGATWRVNKDSLAMTKRWVAAIQGAQHSIHIASTHLRLRPLVDALVAKKQQMPSIDIKVYLDQQEWISTTGDSQQKADVNTCLAGATTDTQKRDCMYNDFLFGKTVVDAGIDTRFKAYSYRWDHTYAAQQHSKYMVIDGKEVFSGSFNLSMNSENGTFENALHVTGYPALVAGFEANFASIWETGRADDLLGKLKTQVTTNASIPLIFPSMALTWSEYDALKKLIRANCTQADSTEFRANPAAHRTCARQ
jgi:phosphatidylserine/phosphatidylglycerophosphate/cardiolipin synthase-like enzyme